MDGIRIKCDTYARRSELYCWCHQRPRIGITLWVHGGFDDTSTSHGRDHGSHRVELPLLRVRCAGLDRLRKAFHSVVFLCETRTDCGYHCARCIRFGEQPLGDIDGGSMVSCLMHQMERCFSHLDGFLTLALLLNLYNIYMSLKADYWQTRRYF